MCLIPPVALPGDQILKIWTNGIGYEYTVSRQNMFVKLLKRLAPGRVARGHKTYHAINRIDR
jgi:hypothetical protein